MSRAPIVLVPARLTLTASGVPYSEAFGDVYHSADGGFGQAQHVFLAGNDLPHRWRGRETFTIVETGFGLGLNFLATWAALREDAHAPARLNFVSAEKHPFSATDLETLHARWPKLALLAQELRAAWPPLIAGFHRVHLDDGRITLTLLFGDALHLLPQLQACADAFYLDGFAPAKNPELWSPPLFAALARLAAPGATLATYTVAGAVRDALAAAGFATEKREGFGRKREMLVGWRSASTPSVSAPGAKCATIIGAGIAGTTCAERLAARGWHVHVVERHNGPAQEASGNPSGILRPVLNRTDTAPARLSRSAFAYALHRLDRLQRADPGVIAGRQGVLQLALKPGDAERLAGIVASLGLPEEFVRPVDAAVAAQLAGRAVGAAGCWFPKGSWINPPSLCTANLTHHGERITRHFHRTALRLERGGGIWRVWGEAHEPIAETPIVILANGFDCLQLPQAARLPLHAVRGQISYLPAAASRHLAIAVSGDGYVAPMPGGGHCFGATFGHDDAEPVARVSDHRENLARLEALLPGFAAGCDAETLGGRVAWRTTTPDRLPVFGELEPGLHAATGLGSRGLLWAPLGAELLAARLTEEPLPLERELAAAVDPARFLGKSSREVTP